MRHSLYFFNTFLGLSIQAFGHISFVLMIRSIPFKTQIHYEYSMSDSYAWLVSSVRSCLYTLYSFKLDLLPVCFMLWVFIGEILLFFFLLVPFFRCFGPFREIFKLSFLLGFNNYFWLYTNDVKNHSFAFLSIVFSNCKYSKSFHFSYKTHQVLPYCILNYSSTFPLAFDLYSLRFSLCAFFDLVQYFFLFLLFLANFSIFNFLVILLSHVTSRAWISCHLIFFNLLHHIFHGLLLYPSKFFVLSHSPYEVS